ncbi:hypothetical protein [Streptomyces sp. NPDC054961]
MERGLPRTRAIGPGTSLAAVVTVLLRSLPHRAASALSPAAFVHRVVWFAAVVASTVATFAVIRLRDPSCPPAK